MPRRHTSGSAGPQRQFRSELDLLRDGERIVDLDPEIANGALQLGVAEQQLHGSQVAGLSINLSRLRSAQRMRAVSRTIKTGALHPSMNDAGVLSRREMRLLPKAARKQVSNAVANALAVRSDAKPAAALARPRLAHELCQTIHRGFGLNSRRDPNRCALCAQQRALVYAGDDAFCANSVTRRCLAEDLRRVETGSLSAGQLLDDLVGAGESRVRQREAGRTSGL